MTIGGLQLATMVVMLVRSKALAVMLGPDGVGLMAVIDKLLAVVVQGLSLSLPFAAVRFLPRLWSSDRAQCYRIFRAMSACVFVLALLFTVIGVTTSLVVPGMWGEQFARHGTVLAAAFLGVVAVAFAPLLQNAYAGVMQHRSSMTFGLSHAVVLAAAGLIGASMTSLTTVYLVYAIAAGALVAVVWLRLARHMRPVDDVRVRGWRDWLPSRQIFAFSGAMFLLALLAPYAALNAHYQVLSSLGTAAAGWMQAAIGISLAVRSLLGAAHPIYLTPQLNQRDTWGARMAWADQFQRLWCLLAAVLVPPLLLAADLAIVALYAESFLPATRFVHLFVLGEVLILVAGTYQGLILAGDRLKFHVAQNLLAQLIFVAVALATIPSAGIAGAAYGGIAAQLFILVCTLGYLAVRERLWPPWRTAVLMAYTLALIVITGVLGADGLLWSGHGSLMTASMVYLASLAGLALFLTRADWQQLGAMARRFDASQR